MDKIIFQRGWKAMPGKKTRKKDEIEAICKKLKAEEEIPKKSVEEIIALYDRVSAKQLTPKNKDITFCAIIVMGCNSKRTPVSIKEAAKAVGLISFVDSKRKYHKKKNEKTFLLNNSQEDRQLIKKVNRRMRSLRQNLKIRAEIMKPDDYIDRFCEKISLDEKIAEQAKKKTINKELEGMKPSGVAAAAIKLVLSKKITVQKLTKITGIPEVTIRKAKRMIEEQ